MPFARKITKATYDSMTGDNAPSRKFYKENPDEAGTYVLDIEPDTALADALSAKQHEIDARQNLQTKLDAKDAELTAEKTKVKDLEAEKRAGWKKDPDRDAIENDLRGQLQAEKDGRAADVKAANAAFDAYMIQQEAGRIADTISTSPSLLRRVLEERLTVDRGADKPIIRVTKDGKPSAMSLTELSNEFVANPEYKGIIRASNASGGGAGSNGVPGGSGGSKSFKDMNEAERTNLYRTDRATFDRESAAHRAASQ